MRATLILGLLVLAFFSQAGNPFASSDDNSGALQEFSTQVNEFLGKHVRAGLVDYAGIKSSPAQLNALVSQVADLRVDGETQSAQKAFYLNAYNVLVIRNMVDNWPIASPLDKDGFFDKKSWNVAGQSLTLSDLENKLIRPRFEDARIHFALVCAAMGCPKLPSEAFDASKLDTQLDRVTRQAMNDSGFTRVNGNKVELSQIFNWYRVDFPGNINSDLIPWINKYRSSAIPASAAVSFYEYDWKANAR